MFVRGGYVRSGNYLSYAGDTGSYRSSVGNYSDYAYYLDFDSGGANPSVLSTRFYGYSIRCVALGG